MRYRRALVLVVPLLAAAFAARHVVFNGDIEYAFGGLETAGRGGAGGPVDIFIARPVAYRLLVSLLDQGRGLVTDDASSLLAQHVIRVETVVMVGAVALLLYLGLRRCLPRARSLLIAFAVGVTFTIAPPFHLLEPDWVGALVATAAVGGALAPRRPMVGGIVGGVLLWLTVAMKVATAPWAILAVGVIVLFSRRRAVVAGGLSVGMVVAWLVLTRSFMPLEWTWLQDMVDLVTTSPLSHGFSTADLTSLARGVVNAAVISPIVVVLPASLAVLVLARPGHRVLASLLAVCAVVLSVGSAYGQGEWFQYHFAGLPVLVAGCWAAALTSTRSRTSWWILVLAPLSLGVASAVVLAEPVGWRHAHYPVVAAAYIALSCGCVALVLVASPRTRDDEPSRSGVAVAGLALSSTAICLSAVVASLPDSGLAFDAYDAAGTPRAMALRLQNSRQQYAELHGRISKDTPVLYMTFGVENYLMGNPTPCRYPSPEWLQRSTSWSYVRDFASYRDNARCVTDDSRARFLVVTPSWLDIQRLEAGLRSQLELRFDCSPPMRIYFSRPGVYLCPLRTAGSRPQSRVGGAK